MKVAQHKRDHQPFAHGFNVKPSLCYKLKFTPPNSLSNWALNRHTYVCICTSSSLEVN